MEKVSAEILQAVILTKNEEPNIKRVLERLTWLERVILLDSFSSDRTIEIIASFPNVEIHYRDFDTHANQWNFGLSLAKSKWVLSLDADYVLTDEFIQETKAKLFEDKAAFYTRFKFLVFGKQLISDNTTPRPVLFQKEFCTYYDDGHTQRLSIAGTTGIFKNTILHDDRKSLSRWLSNQDKYSIKECDKLLSTETKESPSMIARIRKTKIFAPVFVFFYCLFFKGLILNGWTGWYYTLQRTMVEMLFALRMIENEKMKA
jgi:glycosyltransferase involved in cell wall biosynthesis